MFRADAFWQEADVSPQGSGAPDAVNFDRLWDAAFRPAIHKAGYEPVRADLDLGSLLLPTVLERMAISDLVLADVSIPSPQMYYAIGVRHAARQQGCIITAASWSRPVFDIDQMRQVRYPLSAELISDETASEIAHVVTSAMTLAPTSSPVFQIFPSYPSIDSKRTGFKSQFAEISRFQEEITALREMTSDERRQKALELRDRYYSGGPIQPAVAMELIFTLRDCTDWRTTLDFIESLPNELKNSPAIKEQRALAISRSGDHDEAIAALQELIDISGETSERFGLLAGRYQKKWSYTSNPAYLDRAIAAYEAAMKLDLNDYYPSSNLPRLYRIRNRKGDNDRARIIAGVVLTACERAKSRKPVDEWLNPTLLGSAFDAGDVEKAQELADMIAMDGPAFWKLQTTIDDLRIAVQFHEEPQRSELSAVASQLEKLMGR